MKNARILFMGTPDFAVPTLNALIDGGYNVIGVVTQPDKPFGRGYTLKAPPVKEAALAKNIPVYQPESLKKVYFEQTLNELCPDAIIVVAYGKILYPYIIRNPKFGCINVHGSILPEYRGAAPMQRAIIEGKKETGVTIMKMDNGLDTGDMLYIARCPIEENDNFEIIHDRLAALGADALIHTLDALARGEIVAEKQNDALSTYAAKIENEDCSLDFTRSARALHDQIRGLSPFPLALCRHRDKRLKVIASIVVDDKKIGGESGTVLSVANGKIEVACGEGILAITSLQPEGKKRMNASDFINGRGIAVGEILSEFK
jgi:methionyl-tRNA formyltransferase